MSGTRRLFGTDGVRGTANLDPMTADVALRLGQAAGVLFTRGSHRHRVVIGKDTRLSGYLIEPALTAGFVGAGMDVTLVGPLPTPAIAMLTRSLRADLGVMISASHNPYEDNGIKLFGPDGYKLSDATEAEIEALMASPGLAVAPRRVRRPRPRGAAGGRRRPLHRGGEGHVSARPAPRRAARGGRLRARRRLSRGARRCCGNWARRSSRSARRPMVSTSTRTAARPCPSTLCAQVVEHGADLGIALDGDADRVLLSDERGELIDGDQILALIARSWHATGRLAGDAIVATVMSNLGLERFLSDAGLALHRTKVGDRYVSERMRDAGCNIGGEQSGHMILADFATTGDGLVAALQVLAVDRRPRARGERGVPDVHAAAATPEERAFRRREPSRDPRGGQRHRRRPATAERRRPPADPRKRHRAGHPRDGGSRGRSARCAHRRRGLRRHRRRRTGAGARALKPGRVRHRHEHDPAPSGWDKLMAPRRLILIVGDDNALCGLITEQFAAAGEFTAISANSVAEAETSLNGSGLRFDAIVLDVGLPDGDGREYCAELRRRGVKVPIIGPAGSDEESDVVRGLEAGANDYVTKPFRLPELLARVRAQLRGFDSSEDAVFTIGQYTFRPSAKLLHDAGRNKRIRLTTKEVAILKSLYRASPEPMARKALLNEVWRFDAPATTHTLETHIHRLRHKIEIDPSNPRLLVTEDGHYRLQAAPSSSIQH